MPRSGNSALYAVWVPVVTSLVVAGASGIVSQYVSGTMISRGSVPTGYSITGLWGDSVGTLWATATDGTDGAVFKH